MLWSFASLDIVTGGLLGFGVGSGYRDVECDAFGVPSDKEVRRFTENLCVVEDPWRGEEVFTDQPWCPLDWVRATLRPVQQPRPAIWTAANADTAVQRRARLADTWLIDRTRPATPSSGSSGCSGTRAEPTAEGRSRSCH